MLGRRKALFIVLSVIGFTFVFSTIAVFALTPTLLVGTDPAGDAKPTMIDVLKVYYANDAIIFQFFINLSSTPKTSGGLYYTISLDTMSGGATSGSKWYWPGSDYYLYFNIKGAFLYKWFSSNSSWGKIATLEVDTTTIYNTLILTGRLNDIGYPWSPQLDMGVLVATGSGNTVQDWAPNKPNPNTFNHYTISYYDVPEIPWPILPIFTGGIVVTVSLLYKYKFQPRRKEPNAEL